MARSQLNAFAWSTHASEAPLPQPQGPVLTSRRPPSSLAWASCPLRRPSASSAAQGPGPQPLSSRVLTSTMSFWWAEFLSVMYMIKASIMVITVAHGKAKIAGCMPGGERGPGHCPGSWCRRPAPRRPPQGREQSNHSRFSLVYMHPDWATPKGKARILQKPSWHVQGF